MRSPSSSRPKGMPSRSHRRRIPLAAAMAGLLALLGLVLPPVRPAQAANPSDIPTEVTTDVSTVSSLTSYPDADMATPVTRLDTDPTYVAYPIDAMSFRVFAHASGQGNLTPRLVQDSSDHYTLTIPGTSSDVTFYLGYLLPGSDSYAVEPDYNTEFVLRGSGVQSTVKTAAHAQDVTIRGFRSLDGITDLEMNYGTLLNAYTNDSFARRVGGTGAAGLINATMTAALMRSQSSLASYSSADAFVAAKGLLRGSGRYRAHAESASQIVSYTTFATDYGSSYEAYMAAQVAKYGAAGYTVEPEAEYRLYVVLRKGATGVDSAASGKSQGFLDYAKSRGMSCVERDGLYYVLYSTYTTNYYLSSQMSAALDSIRSDYGIAAADSTYQIETYVQNRYELYYDFSERDAGDAWAAEMNLWGGHWDHLLHGCANYDYGCSCGTNPGYEELWHSGGSTFYSKEGYVGYAGTVTAPTVYSYHFDKSGTYTLQVTGHNGLTSSFAVTLDVKVQGATPDTPS